MRGVDFYFFKFYFCDLNSHCFRESKNFGRELEHHLSCPGTSARAQVPPLWNFHNFYFYFVVAVGQAALQSFEECIDVLEESVGRKDGPSLNSTSLNVSSIKMD